MKASKLFVLLVIAMVFLAVAIVTYHRQGALTDSDVAWMSGPLLSRIGDRVEEIDTIELTKDDTVLVLARGDQNEWSVASSGGYPADNKKIARLIFQLTDLKAGDRMTRRAEKYSDFGVEGEVGEGGALKLSTAQGEAIAALVLGKRREVDPESNTSARPGGHYIRVGSDPYVYLAAADNLWSLSADVSRWVETKIVNVPSGSIVDVTVDHGTTETFHLTWDDGKVKLEKVEEGMQQKEYEVNNVRGAMSRLNLSGVAPAGSDAMNDLDWTTTHTAKAKDGTAYRVAAAQKDAKNYVRLSATYDEPFFTDDDTATTATLKEAEEKAAAAEKAVPGFNEKHRPWVYEIPSWNWGKFTKKRSDLMEPMPAKEEEDEAE